MKYLKMIVTLMLIVALSGCANHGAIQEQSLHKTMEHKVVDAKTDYYENLEDLELKSPLVLIGTKLSEDEPFISYSPTGTPSFGFTKSQISIDNILKNNSKIDIKEGSTITVIENQFTDKKTNTIYHIAGYSKMEENKQYLLYLYYSDDDKWFVPMGVTFGKVPLNREDTVVVKAMNNTEQTLPEKVIREAQLKYSKYIK